MIIKFEKSNDPKQVEFYFPRINILKSYLATNMRN